MSQLQASRFCRTCNKRTLHARRHFSAGMGCLLTILTAGLFLIVWLFIILLEALQPWRCQTCGKAKML